MFKRWQDGRSEGEGAGRESALLHGCASPSPLCRPLLGFCVLLELPLRIPVTHHTTSGQNSFSPQKLFHYLVGQEILLNSERDFFFNGLGSFKNRIFSSCLSLMHREESYVEKPMSLGRIST